MFSGLDKQSIDTLVSFLTEHLRLLLKLLQKTNIILQRIDSGYIVFQLINHLLDEYIAILLFFQLEVDFGQADH